MLRAACARAPRSFSDGPWPARRRRRARARDRGPRGSAIVYESEPLAAQLRALFVDGDLVTSRRISGQEAAKFEQPESVRQRLKKELAALFEDQY